MFSCLNGIVVDFARNPGHRQREFWRIPLLTLKRFTLHQCVDEFADGELFAFGCTDDFNCQIFIGKSERAA